VTYRDRLPQLDGGLFLTDGGLETVLVFHEGLELPAFAAFPLLGSEPGRRTIRRYYEPFLELAREAGAGFVLETPTWRASPRWAAQLGYDDEQLDWINRRGVALMEELRDEHADVAPIVVSGLIGPQDDAYDPALRLSAHEARAYHAMQIATFADTAADLVTAMTITYADEAIGVSQAAADVGLPVVVSFTVETDGRLPSGQPLADAIAAVDDATGAGPAYYMVNCAHPTHFAPVFEADGPWQRVRGLRANASMRSHAELDEAPELDEGDPVDLGARYAALAPRLGEVCVLGGCCGTDHRHVAEIARAWPRRAPVA
jgi:S-methylmethionine-dependent homocysteine/selenocysteine methylase